MVQRQPRKSRSKATADHFIRIGLPIGCNQRWRRRNRSEVAQNSCAYWPNRPVSGRLTAANHDPIPVLFMTATTLSSYSKDGILTVLFNDSRLLDEAKLEQLGTDLIAQLNGTTEERVILDFRSVQFMSSSMLGKLV